MERHEVVIRSSWFVDENGEVYEADRYRPRRLGRALQRAKIRERIAEHGYTQARGRR